MKISKNYLEYIYYLKILNYLKSQNLIDNSILEKVKYNLLKSQNR